MTLLELKERIDTQLRINHRAKDWEVVIPISRPSVGPRSCMSVEGVGFGFDWDAGKVFINPLSSVIEKDYTGA